MNKTCVSVHNIYVNKVEYSKVFNSAYDWLL